MANWKKQLEQYGADVSAALERLGGDEELYCMCIKMFLEDALYNVLWECRQRIERQQECFCTEQALDAAHTLKGVAANLELTPLYQSLSELCTALRQKDEVDAAEKYQRFVKEWERAGAVWRGEQ
ncbi:MAG: Hpt domain-containing protein [Lachnospiraceae bacterium]|nr:Hpt domain-containing protein [Lachnospiraceae bacterium]